jgi:hypothetical protein
VLQTESGSKRPELGVVPRSSVAYDLNNPMVLSVTNGCVAVTRNFPITLCNRGSDLVRVEVTASLGVDQTNNVTVARVAELLLRIVLDLVAVGVEEPVVVGILVVVASDLLLGRALGVCLDVRVEQSTSVSHVLQCGAGTVCDFERAVLANLSSSQVGLEERAHLRITGTAVFEDDEVEVEGEHVDGEGDEDQTENAESEMRG